MKQIINLFVLIMRMKVIDGKARHCIDIQCYNITTIGKVLYYNGMASLTFAVYVASYWGTPQHSTYSLSIIRKISGNAAPKRARIIALIVKELASVAVPWSKEAISLSLSLGANSTRYCIYASKYKINCLERKRISMNEK